LDVAVAFLQAHGRAVKLVTLDIGANDLLYCTNGETGGIDADCRAAAFTSLADHLPSILTTLRAAAAPGVPIVALNYYNPFIAVWSKDPALAYESATLVSAFNALLENIYADFDVPVGDVAHAFHADDFTLVPLLDQPVNVALLCQLTWMCAPSPQGPNIHANTSGYFVIALALLAAMH